MEYMGYGVWVVKESTFEFQAPQVNRKNVVYSPRSPLKKSMKINHH